MSDKTTDYIGNIIYQNDELSYILMPEGRIIVNSEKLIVKSEEEEDTTHNSKLSTNNYIYEYFVKDHLGDTRLVISEDGTIKESNSYYPFGMQISALSMSSTEPGNKYLYNGKEFADDYGLDWYEYGARMYDAQIGRWSTIDPLAVKRSWLTPYQYAQNNPILLIDPDGRLDDEGWVITHDEVLWDNRVHNNRIAEKRYGDGAMYGGENEIYYRMNSYDNTVGYGADQGRTAGQFTNISMDENSIQINLDPIIISANRVYKSNTPKLDNSQMNWLEELGYNLDNGADKVGPVIGQFLMDINPIYTFVNAGTTIITGKNLKGEIKTGASRYISPIISTGFSIFTSYLPGPETLIELIYGTGTEYILDKAQSNAIDNLK